MKTLENFNFCVFKWHEAFSYQAISLYLLLDQKKMKDDMIIFNKHWKDETLKCYVYWKALICLKSFLFIFNLHVYLIKLEKNEFYFLKTKFMCYEFMFLIMYENKI